MIWIILIVLYLISTVISYIGIRQDYKEGVRIGPMGLLCFVPILNFVIAWVILDDWTPDIPEPNWNRVNNTLFGERDKENEEA